MVNAVSAIFSTMVEYKDRLEQAMKDRGVSVTQLADALGMSYQAVKKVLDGKSGAFTAANNARAASFLGVSSDWLAVGSPYPKTAGGVPMALATSWPFSTIPEDQVRKLSDAARLQLEGALALAVAQLGLGMDIGSPKKPERRNDVSEILKTSPTAANDPDFVAIRTVSMKISAGVTGFSVDPEEDDGTGGLVYLSRAWMEKRGYRAGALFAVRAKGFSMWPRVYPDDVTLINTDDTKKAHKQVYAFNHEGEFTLKRLVREHNRWFLQSDNPDKATYPPVLASELTFPIGRAVLLQAEEI
jgi:phage repressor protein C with HTH and peptisase S24 domain